MFLQELIPLYEEWKKEPIAFMGGFVSGILRLDLREDPLASWLDSQKTKNIDIEDL
jgi:hypothetical protein